MIVDKVVLRQFKMPLVHFFETSFGRTYHRDIILVEAFAAGVSGWGEVTAGENPFYNEEWTGSIWPLLIDYAVPRVLHHPFETAASVKRVPPTYGGTTWLVAGWKRPFGTSRPA